MRKHQIVLVLMFFLLNACNPNHSINPTSTPNEHLTQNAMNSTYQSTLTPVDQHSILIEQIILGNSGLVMVRVELKEVPELDPLSFITRQGNYWDRSSLPRGDSFLSNSFYEDGHFSLKADWNSSTLIARENFNEDGSAAWVTLEKDEQEIYRIDTGRGSPVSCLRSLWTFDGHWLLETAFVTETVEDNSVRTNALGQLIQDGEDLNQKFGYDESFGFQTIAGKPFYFIRKAEQIKAIVDGEEIPLGFDLIPHYGCCSSGEMNLQPFQDRVNFFGKQDDTWFFVQIGIPGSVFNPED